MKKNRKIKIYIFALFILIAFTILSPSTAGAAESIFDKMNKGLSSAVKEAYGGGEEILIGSYSFSLNIIHLINYALTFIGIIFLALLLYAGYLWLTARGNEEQVDKAKKIIREVVTALIIIIGARLLTEFLLTVFGQATQPLPPES